MRLTIERYIGCKLVDVYEELKQRYGSHRVNILHEGLPGNIDYQPNRLNFWVDEDSIITRITKN